MVPTMPVVRSLNHPTFFQWREAFRSLRTRLYFNAPISTMLRQPCFKVVIVILLIRKNCDETRKVAINLEYQIMWRGTNRVFCNSWGVLECFPDCVATEPQHEQRCAAPALAPVRSDGCCRPARGAREPPRRGMSTSGWRWGAPVGALPRHQRKRAVCFSYSLGYTTRVGSCRPKGEERVLRGGSWFLRTRAVWSVQRRASQPGLLDAFIGFRLARGQA